MIDNVIQTRRRLLALAVAGAASPLAAGLPAAARGECADDLPGSEAGATYLIVYRPGPAWLRGKPVSEQPLLEHGRYMLSLYKQGVLKLAGPFTDDTGGAVIFQAQDDTHARAVVAADPAVVSRVFRYDLHPWKLVRWDRLVHP